MSISALVFYVLAAVTLAGAISAVTSVKVLRSAAYLLFSLLGITGLYFWLNYPLAATTQLFIYAGGVMLPIIYAVFLTHGVNGEMKDPVKVRAVFAGLTCLAGYMLVYYVMQRTSFGAEAGISSASGPSATADQFINMSTGKGIVSIVVCVLLAAAVFACAALTVTKNAAK